MLPIPAFHADAGVDREKEEVAYEDAQDAEQTEEGRRGDGRFQICPTGCAPPNHGVFCGALRPAERIGVNFTFINDPSPVT